MDGLRWWPGNVLELRAGLGPTKPVRHRTIWDRFLGTAKGVSPHAEQVLESLQLLQILRQGTGYLGSFPKDIPLQGDHVAGLSRGAT